MRLKLIGLLIILSSVVALANNCTTSTTGNFQTTTWATCGSSYPGAGDTATITGIGVVVTIPVAETDSVGTTGGTNPVVTVSAGASLVNNGTLTVGANPSNATTTVMLVTDSNSNFTNNGTFNSQGNLTLNTNGKYYPCADSVTNMNSNGGFAYQINTVIGVIGTSTAAIDATGCVANLPRSGHNARFTAPTGQIFTIGDLAGLHPLAVNFNFVTIDPSSCGSANQTCMNVAAFKCRNTNFVGVGPIEFGQSTAPGEDIDWNGCHTRLPLATQNANGKQQIYCPVNTVGAAPTGLRRIVNSTFDTLASDTTDVSAGSITLNCPGFTLDNDIFTDLLNFSSSRSYNGSITHSAFLKRNWYRSTPFFILTASGNNTISDLTIMSPPSSLYPIGDNPHWLGEAGIATQGTTGYGSTLKCNTYSNVFMDAGGTTIAPDAAGDTISPRVACSRVYNWIVAHYMGNTGQGGGPSPFPDSNAETEHATYADDKTNNGNNNLQVMFEDIGQTGSSHKTTLNHGILADKVNNLITSGSSSAGLWQPQRDYTAVNVTNVSVSGSTAVTVTAINTGTYPIIAGDQVYFGGSMNLANNLVNATWLNGQMVVVTTANSSGFTFTQPAYLCVLPCTASYSATDTGLAATGWFYDYNGISNYNTQASPACGLNAWNAATGANGTIGGGPGCSGANGAVTTGSCTTPCTSMVVASTTGILPNQWISVTSTTGIKARISAVNTGTSTLTIAESNQSGAAGLGVTITSASVTTTKTYWQNGYYGSGILGYGSVEKYATGTAFHGDPAHSVSNDACTAATWDSSLGGPGTLAHAIDQMMLVASGLDANGSPATPSSTQYTPANFNAYWLECFRPTNAATAHADLFDAVSGVGTDLGYIGTVIDSNGVTHVGGYSGTTSLAAPTFSVPSGTYIGTQSVTITITSGATGCYTIDGTTPTATTAGTCTNGTTYSSPVSVAVDLTLKAIATESGFFNSAVASASYVITTQMYVTVAPLPAAKVGVPYTTTLTATGGTGTYTWALLGSTPLPAGLSLSSGGVISGTPTDGGTFTKTTSFGVTATDAGLGTNTGGAPFIIIVLPVTYSAPGIPQNQISTTSGLNLAGNLAQYIAWWPLHLTYYSGSAGGNNIAPSGLPAGHFWDTYVDGANNYPSEMYPSEYAAADDNGWNPEISFLHNPVDYETTGYYYFSINMDQFDAWERTYAGIPNDNSLLNSVNGIFNCPATGACTDVTIQLYCPADAPFGVTDCNSYTPTNTTVVDHLLIGKQLPIYLINVNVVTPLSGGTVAYQYWSSMSNSYVNIPLSSGLVDGTFGLTTSGQITFSPPGDWVRNVDGGTYKKFHVRVQLSGSSPSVTLSRVWGDNMLAVAKTASLTGIAITTSVTGTNPQTVILTAPATNTFGTAGPPYVQLSGLTNTSLSVLNGYWGFITAASGTTFTMSLSVPSTVGAVVSACSSPCTESGSSAVTTYYKNRGWNPGGCTAGHVNAGTEVEYCGTPSTTGTAKLRGEGRIMLHNYKTYLGNHVAFANGKYAWAVSKLYQANWVLAKEAQPPQNGVSWDDGGQNLAWLNYSTTEYGSTPWGSLTPSQADGIFYPQLYLLMKQNHPTFSNMPNSTNRALQFFYTMGMDIGHYEDTNHMSNGTTLDTDSALASCPDSIWCHSSAYNIGTTITNYEGTTTTQWHIGQYPGVRMVARSWDALQLYAFSDNQLPAASETVANYHVTDMDTEAIAAFAGYLMIKNPNVYFTYDPASYGTGHVDGADDYYYWVTSSSTLQTALSPQLCLTGTSPCTISLSGNITPSAMACPGVGKPTTITTSQCPIRIGGKGGDVISVPITGNNYPACSSGSPCTVAVAFSACSVYYNCPAIVQSHVTGSTIEYMVKALQSTQVGPYPTSSIAQWGYHIPISDVYLGIPDPANGYDAPCRNDVYYKVGSNPGFTGFPHKYRLQDCELANFQTYVPNYPALCDITGTISTNGFCSQIVRRDFKQGTYGNAIVLYRPANSTTDGSVRTATAEYDTLSNPIPLGGTFYALNSDGTVSTTPVTTVQLKARQAFIGVTQTVSSSVVITNGFSMSGGGVIR